MQLTDGIFIKRGYFQVDFLTYSHAGNLSTAVVKMQATLYTKMYIFVFILFCSVL